MKVTAVVTTSLLMMLQPIGASSMDQVPLSAVYEGAFTIAGPLLTFSGNGTATHFGNSAILGETVLAPDAARPFCFIFVEDHVTLTAANGDELHLGTPGRTVSIPRPEGSSAPRRRRLWEEPVGSWTRPAVERFRSRLRYSRAHRTVWRDRSSCASRGKSARPAQVTDAVLAPAKDAPLRHCFRRQE